MDAAGVDVPEGRGAGWGKPEGAGQERGHLRSGDGQAGTVLQWPGGASDGDAGRVERVDVGSVDAVGFDILEGRRCLFAATATGRVRAAGRVRSAGRPKGDGPAAGAVGVHGADTHVVGRGVGEACDGLGGCRAGVGGVHPAGRGVAGGGGEPIVGGLFLVVHVVAGYVACRSGPGRSEPAVACDRTQVGRRGQIGSGQGARAAGPAPAAGELTRPGADPQAVVGVGIQAADGLRGRDAAAGHGRPAGRGVAGSRGSRVGGGRLAVLDVVAVQGALQRLPGRLDPVASGSQPELAGDGGVGDGEGDRIGAGLHRRPARGAGGHRHRERLRTFQPPVGGEGDRDRIRESGAVEHLERGGS